MTVQKLRIAPASLLVLAYAGKLYGSPVEQAYLSRIDFEEVKEVMDKLNNAFPYVEEIITLRKQFVRDSIAEQVALQNDWQVMIRSALPLLFLKGLFTTSPIQRS